MKLLKKILFLFLLVAVIASCTKADKDSSQTFENQKAKINQLSLASVVELMENKDDPDDEDVNMQLYEWGLEVRDSMSNPQFYSSMLNELINDYDHVMTFAELDIIPATATVEYDNVTYYPHVWLYNADTVDGELDPYLCLATDIEVEKALAVYDPNEEYISGWKLFNMEDIVLGLHDAENIQNPLFIIGFAEEKCQTFGFGPPRRSYIDHPIENLENYKRFWVKAFKIDHRYDKSRKSEVRMNYYLTVDGTAYNSCRMKIPVQEIHKDDLNKWEYFSVPMLYSERLGWGCTDGDPIPINDEVLLTGILFEWDWWCLSRKKINLGGYEMKYRTKYSGHYYNTFIEADISVGNGNYLTGSRIKIFQDE